MASNSEINKIAMIGCGAMGGGMALLFAENGCNVYLRDPSNEAMNKVLDQAKKDNVGEKLSKYQDNESLCKVCVNSHPFAIILCNCCGISNMFKN